MTCHLITFAGKHTLGKSFTPQQIYYVSPLTWVLGASKCLLYFYSPHKGVLFHLLLEGIAHSLKSIGTIMPSDCILVNSFSTAGCNTKYTGTKTGVTLSLIYKAQMKAAFKPLTVPNSCLKMSAYFVCNSSTT